MPTGDLAITAQYCQIQPCIVYPFIQYSLIIFQTDVVIPLKTVVQRLRLQKGRVGRAMVVLNRGGARVGVPKVIRPGKSQCMIFSLFRRLAGFIFLRRAFSPTAPGVSLSRLDTSRYLFFYHQGNSMRICVDT
jgi:hypothetical protein